VKKNVLIVEDEKKISQVLVDYFTVEGFDCTVLYRGDEVISLWHSLDAKQRPDLILLDVQIPGKSGLDVCRELRALSNIPIIMVTARVDEIDRLLGLELGADDYICKPFSPREVVARVRAVLRRASPTEPLSRPTDELQLGRIRLEIPARLAYVDQQPVSLTPVEFDLLLLFLQRPREVLSRTLLLKHAKGTAFEGYERNMDSHVKNLRKKLKKQLADIDPFRSVYGVGYALKSEVLEIKPE
jgi:two-component system response regulator BaeR